MLEKLKDMLYEISDLLLALVILLIMSAVITWQVTDSLAYNHATDIKDYEVAQEDTQEHRTVETEISDFVPSDDSGSSTPDQNTSHNENTQQRDEEFSTPADKQDQSSEEIQPVVIQVTIPNGTPGSGIAKILKEKNLIDHTAKFIARVEELKLAAKLKSGTFQIENGTSLDEIIYIITGQKK